MPIYIRSSFSALGTLSARSEGAEQIESTVHSSILWSYGDESDLPVFTETYQFNLAKDLKEHKTLPLNLKLKNIIIKGNCLLLNSPNVNSEFYQIEGIVCFGSSMKYYIGNNFSGFYFSWKLGKIGLITFDGRGSFQGKIDEEWLKNNGFEKKVV